MHTNECHELSATEFKETRKYNLGNESLIF